jgi:hypothetical protein
MADENLCAKIVRAGRGVNHYIASNGLTMRPDSASSQTFACADEAITHLFT